MEQLARIIIFLEMLVVNLITSHRCSRKKYSLIGVIGELFLFTVLVIVISFLIRLKLNSTYVLDDLIQDNKKVTNIIYFVGVICILLQLIFSIVMSESILKPITD